jgi:hypothetical protein
MIEIPWEKSKSGFSPTNRIIWRPKSGTNLCSFPSPCVRHEALPQCDVEEVRIRRWDCNCQLDLKIYSALQPRDPASFTVS